MSAIPNITQLPARTARNECPGDNGGKKIRVQITGTIRVHGLRTWSPKKMEPGELYEENLDLVQAVVDKHWVDFSNTAEWEFDEV